MDVALGTPDVAGLDAVGHVLRGWQDESAPMQLHPGDLGWFRRWGAERAAAATRTWSSGGEVVALGLLDDPDLLRMTLAPGLLHDDALAERVVADLVDPDRGVLPAGKAFVEVPTGTRVQDLLGEHGWQVDVPWTPLRRDLSAPVEDPGLRVEVVGPEQAERRSAVQRAAFEGSTFTRDRWQAMASSAAYDDARCLLGLDEHGEAVAAVTVWSSGPGVPGLIEPMGVHRDHRGRGHGRAITVAAAAALRELGSSSALVCTPSANEGAVATYASAGFRPMAQVHDRRRDG